MRDKLLTSALYAGYMDHVPRDRFPVVALFLRCGPRAVDVNVHPAKAEVRFRDSSLVRGLVVSAIRDALSGALHRASTTGGTRTLDALASRTLRGGPHGAPARPAGGWDPRRSVAAPADPRGYGAPRGFPESPQASFETKVLRRSSPTEPSAPLPSSEPDVAVSDEDAPLGAARAQFHETYILAQTRDGIVIVDQHAAHERLVYERLKRARAEGGIGRQMMLIPAIVELPPDDAAALLDEAEALSGARTSGWRPSAAAPWR